LIPNLHQSILELMLSIPLNLTKDNIETNRRMYYVPLTVSLFMFLLTSNLLGLIPYTYTIGSQLYSGIVIASCVFITLNFICYDLHGSHMIVIIQAKGIPVYSFLGIMLMIIEGISYSFKPIALAIRLFANLMAGHTLLKVILGFSVVLASIGGIACNILQFVPMLIVFPLYSLETFVAVIQAYVFTSLMSIYIHDCESLH